VPVWQVPSLSQQPEQVEGPQESVGTWGHPSNTTTVNTRNKARMPEEHSIAGPRTNYLDTNAKPEGLPSGERKDAWRPRRIEGRRNLTAWCETRRLTVPPRGHASDGG